MLTSLRPATRFDLHMHSTRSDGRFAVQEVLRRAARGGLDVVALTDHDLVTALAPGPHEVEGRTLHVIAGAEVSGVHDGVEYHLLVYFPGEVPEAFSQFCRARCRERAVRYATSIERLGLPDLPEPDAAAREGEHALTRLHLARALVEAGHTPSRGEAFARFLSSRHPVVPSLTTPFVEAIRLARSLGAVTSWAHPPLPAVEAHLEVFVKAGLQGLEALRPTVRGPARRRLRAAARRHGLLLTGGSDWHGWGDPDELGIFRVEARQIPDFVDALRAAA